MKALSILLLCLTCAAQMSCIVASGTDPTGAKWGIGMVGTDAGELVADTGGLHIKDLNQSKGLQIAGDTIKKMFDSYLLAEGLKFLAGEYYNLEGAKVGSAQTIELEKLRNAASEAEFAHQLKMMEAAPVL